jgi:hypothetical protein
MSNINSNIYGYGLTGSSTTTSIIGSSTISGNSVLISSGANYAWRDASEDISEFVEFALKIMGVDLTFEEFKKMDGSERRAFIRDIKIDKIIK